MASRNFDEDYDFEGLEGHTFTLGGKTFSTKPVARVAYLLHDETGVDSSIKFIRSMLATEQDQVAFDLVLSDEWDVVVTAAQVTEVAVWLYGVTSGRPTKSPASSGVGREATGTGSKDTS